MSKITITRSILREVIFPKNTTLTELYNYALERDAELIIKDGKVFREIVWEVKK